ncbi:hypothetical protein ATCC90586_011944 [Pythium insidiosum]|nr:hypothetical protein ATCC90586_011944 [Pythium insidiosum]
MTPRVLSVSSATSLGSWRLPNAIIHDKELLAMKYTLVKFRVYLLGEQQFAIYTDYASLRIATKSPHLFQRMARWLSFFAEYNFVVFYKPGKSSILADALSRRPDYDPREQVSTSGQDECLNYATSFRSWSEMLPLAEFALDNAVHTSTCFTPFFVNYASSKSPPKKTSAPSPTPTRRSARLRARAPASAPGTSAYDSSTAGSASAQMAMNTGGRPAVDGEEPPLGELGEYGDTTALPMDTDDVVVDYDNAMEIPDSPSESMDVNMRVVEMSEHPKLT